MKSVGLVGGLGPESTIDYYRRILARWQEVEPGTSPRILIDSLDVQVGLRLAAGDHRALEEYLFESLERLTRAGVSFLAMTANTGHLVFDELQARASLPMISIVETCADEAERLGLRRLALLGTAFTMGGSFYPAVFERRGLSVFPPDEATRRQVHARYVGELLAGVFLEETRAEMVRVVEQLARAHDVDGVILGGTELPLLLRSSTIAGLPTLDTTALHVEAIVQRLR